jgi:hypothetical protein
MSSHADLARPSTPKRPGQNRQSAPRMDLFRIPVNVPPDVAQFRAEYSAYARWLEPHLANVLIGAICTADAHGEEAETTYEAISAATHTPGLQKRYKCKPVSPMQVERNMPVLRQFGLVSYYSARTRDRYGEVKSRIYLSFTIPNLRNLMARFDQGVIDKDLREARKQKRKAEYEAERNELRKAARARNTVVTCENDEGNNSCPTPNAGSSAGTNAGSSAGRIVPNRSFVTDRNNASSSAAPGCARDDEASSFPSGEDRGGQAPHTPRNPGRKLSLSEYGAAVCRMLNEHLDHPLDPWLFPAAARDLLQRLWPDPQDVPVREIGYGHLEDGWYNASGPKWDSEAAVLASRLRTADEALVRSWVERGAQRLAEMDAADAADREREAQAAATRETINGLRAQLIGTGVLDADVDRHLTAVWNHLASDALIGKLEDWLERQHAKAEFGRLLPELTALVARYHEGDDGCNVDAEVRNELRSGDREDPRQKLARMHQKIQWFTDELAARAARAPLAARCLEYVTTHPGLNYKEIAAALGADPEETQNALYDLVYAMPEQLRTDRGEYYPAD